VAQKTLSLSVVRATGQVQGRSVSQNKKQKSPPSEKKVKLQFGFGVETALGLLCRECNELQQ
jgi:hypothetical protein